MEVSVLVIMRGLGIFNNHLLVIFLLVWNSFRQSWLNIALRILTIGVHIIFHSWISNFNIDLLTWSVVVDIGVGGWDVRVGQIDLLLFGELGGFIDFFVVLIQRGLRLPWLDLGRETIHLGVLVLNQALGNEDVGVAGVVPLAHQK